MDQALHLIADRVAAMAPPALEEPPEDRVYEVGYREGHEDAIKRVVRLLRWIADGEHQDRTAWVWVRNILIPDRQRPVLDRARAEATEVPDPFAMPAAHNPQYGTLWVPVPGWFAQEHKLPCLVAQPPEAFEPRLPGAYRRPRPRGTEK